MNCPKCNSSNTVKDGIVKDKQRFLCKDCKYRYTVKHRGKSPELKKLALHLYLEGLGFRSIERILNVSNVAIMNWIKSFGIKIETIRKTGSPIDIIEMDELHTYIGSKKTISGYGLLLIGMAKDTSISCLVQGERKQD